MGEESTGPPRPSKWATLAAGLAHEIKNPLSTMNLTLQLLREDLKGRETVPPSQIVPRIDLLISEVVQLERILNAFLRLARDPHVERRLADPNALVQETRAFLKPEFQERGVTLVEQLDLGIGSVSLDPALFRQAILNLLKNALQAMPDGGTLTVHTHIAGGQFVLDVIDTGHGIHENLLERIFQGFFSTKPGGSGLGLPITRQIVELHGGTLTCQSAQGSGTRFRITLPLGGPDAGGVAT